MALQKNFLKRQESVKEEPELHEMAVYIDGKDVKQGGLVSTPSLVINDIDDDACLLKDDNPDLPVLSNYDNSDAQNQQSTNSLENSPEKYKDDFSDSVALYVDSGPKSEILHQPPRLRSRTNSPQTPVNLKKLQETMRTRESLTSMGKESTSLSRQNSRCSQRSSSSKFGSRRQSWDAESIKRNSFDNESYSLNLGDSMEVSSVASTPRQRSLEYSFNLSPRTPRTFRPTASPVPHPLRVRPPPATPRSLEERFRDEMRTCIMEQSEQTNSPIRPESKESSFCEPRVVLVMATIVGGMFIVLGAILFGLSHHSTLKFHGGAEPGKALLVLGLLLVGGVAVVLFMHYKKTNSTIEGNDAEHTQTNARAEG